uniref:PDZ and LIM domain protein 3 n=1 Tax=Phallusia mammillata TaxID=59560 RepID=A0A6F9DP49_9ASCI|nr:PDZ and LIM domain protein 3 [Phallusia mammillata]
MEADRSIYTRERDEQERISRHNRSAKPFTAFTPSADPASPETKSVDAPKKSGFKSVAFNPKRASNNGGPSRGQPDGGPIIPTGGEKSDSDLPSPPSDFVVAPAGNQPSAVAANGNKRVLGPNAAAGLYSNANVQEAYKAQVESDDL